MSARARRALAAVAVFLLASAPAACRRIVKDPPATADEARARLVERARAKDAAGVYDLLDRSTRWSLTSIWKDRRRMCELARKHYPAERLGSILPRCRDAEEASDERGYFASFAKGRKLLEELAASPPRAKDPRAFCVEEKAWSYCGLGDELDSLKLKAARDLDTVRENAESFGGAR